MSHCRVYFSVWFHHSDSCLSASTCLHYVCRPISLSGGPAWCTLRSLLATCHCILFRLVLLYFFYSIVVLYYLNLTLAYHTGKTFYRLALMPLTGPMRIPELTVMLQNPQVQYSPGSTPKWDHPLSKWGNPLGLTHCHTHTHTHSFSVLSKRTWTLNTMTSNTHSRNISGHPLHQLSWTTLTGKVQKTQIGVIHHSIIIPICSDAKTR